MIPGLNKAEFLRFGVMHRNSFINSPELLNSTLNLKKHENIYFAGQLSGVEGYMESAACGIVAAYSAASRLIYEKDFILPKNTMIGALLHYITDPNTKKFQPMAANMGLLEALSERIKSKKERYLNIYNKSMQNLAGFIKNSEITRKEEIK